MDAFSPPDASAPGPLPSGRIDLGAAVSTGLGAAAENWTGIIAVVLFMWVAIIVSCCSFVLFPVTYPWIFWGMGSWMIAAIDNKADVSVLWTSVAEDPFIAWARPWGWIILLGIAFLPAYLVVIAITIPMTMETITTGQQPEPSRMMLMNMLSQLPVWLWMLLMVRLYMSFWHLIERRAGVIDSLSLSWNQTAESWGPLALLTTGWFLLNLPYQLAVQGGTAYMQSLPLNQQLDFMAPFYAFVMFGSVVITVLSMVAGLVLAAAHRQLNPLPPETPV